MKVQASIQGTAVRVSGGKKDDLQPRLRWCASRSPTFRCSSRISGTDHPAGFAGTPP